MRVVGTLEFKCIEQVLLYTNRPKQCVCLNCTLLLSAETFSNAVFYMALYPVCALSLNVIILRRGRRRRLSVTLHPHRHTHNFTMEGVHVEGAWPGGLGDGSPPVGSKG